MNTNRERERGKARTDSAFVSKGNDFRVSAVISESETRDRKD